MNELYNRTPELNNRETVSGVISKSLDNKKIDNIDKDRYHIRSLGENDLEVVLGLRNDVMKNIGDREKHGKLPKNSFFAYNDSEWKKLLKTGTKNTIEGIFIDGKLVAVCMFLMMGNDKGNLGTIARFKEEELDNLAELDTTMVHPNYQKNGLGKKVVDAAWKKHLEDYPNVHHVLATAHPLNFASVRLKFEKGMVITGIVSRHVNEPREAHRAVMCGDAHGQKDLGKVIDERTTSDIKEMKALIAKGYVGIATIDNKIVFANHEI